MYIFLSSDQEGIRTLDPQLRRLLLYPTELPDRFSGAKIKKFNLTAKLFGDAQRYCYFCIMKVLATYKPFSLSAIFNVVDKVIFSQVAVNQRISPHPSVYVF